jgi:hypothetical protein
MLIIECLSYLFCFIYAINWSFRFKVGDLTGFGGKAAIPQGLKPLFLGGGMRGPSLKAWRTQKQCTQVPEAMYPEAMYQKLCARGVSTIFFAWKSLLAMSF